MKSFIKWVLILTTVLFIFIIAVIIALSALIDTEPKISSNSYLYIPISGSIADYIPPDPIGDFLGKTTLDLKKIRDTIEKAAVDERINGIILDIGFLQTGYAKLSELHSIITEYRKSGKKIYAFLEIGLMKEYYLALACDSIIMPPTSNLFLHGISSELTFYKGLFDKIGIEAEFLSVGEYKNAPDTYTRESMSDSQREELQRIINIYFDDIISKISNHRALPYSKIDSLINMKTGFTGIEALKLGLIDQTGYFDDIVDKLKTRRSKPSKLHAGTYALIPVSSLGIRNKANLAIVHVSGTIAGGGDSDDPILGSISGADRVVSNLRSAASSRLVKAIILRIDSPGGTSTGSEIILNAVEEAATKKPVIASVADYGASGGYLIALGADTIIAQPNSIVGSIGIFAGKFNLQGTYEKLNMNTERVYRGKNSGLFSLSKPWTKQEKSIIYHLISDYYKHFMNKVSESRNIDLSVIKTLAEGRIYAGNEAEKNKLIDLTGTIYDAIYIAKKLANIPVDQSVRLIYYPKERSKFEEIVGMIKTSVPLNVFALEHEFSILSQLQNKPLALMPYDIKWK